MSYNRVRTPKFYIDAILLARQLGYIETENVHGKYYLNPTKTTNINIDEDNQALISVYLSKRHFLNSITHCFILGHQLADDDMDVQGYIRDDNLEAGHSIISETAFSTNGWSKFTASAGTELDAKRFTLKIIGNEGDSTPIGDISVGWSWTAPNSPDISLAICAELDTNVLPPVFCTKFVTSDASVVVIESLNTTLPNDPVEVAEPLIEA